MANNGIGLTESVQTKDLEMTRAVISMIAIMAVALVLTLYRLGARDVCSANEAVEGVFVQQMVEHGMYLFPLENGRSPMYKPPLFHWTATAIDRLIGATTVSAFNLRLPSVLYATAGVALTMLFVQGIMGTNAAVLAGLTLVGSYQYVTQGRLGRVDMTLSFFEALALFSFFWWIRRNRAGGSRSPGRATQFVCAAALALAVLAKGPVGAIVPLAAMGIFLLAEKRLGETIRRLSPTAAILAVLVSVSWYAACFLNGRHSFLSRQLRSENLGRFVGTLGAMSPSYYLHPLLLNSTPLSLLVPIAVMAAVLFRTRSAAAGAGQSESEALQAVRLCGIFWLVTALFFSVAAYKRRAYLLPLWPPAAVMLAWLVTTITARSARPNVARGYAGLCIVLVVINVVVIPRQAARACVRDSFKPAAEQITRVVAVDQPLYVYGFTEELAPLLFYLDRDAPEIDDMLENVPVGYVIVPARVWENLQAQQRDVELVLTSYGGTQPIALLRSDGAHSTQR